MQLGRSILTALKSPSPALGLQGWARWENNWLLEAAATSQLSTSTSAAAEKKVTRCKDWSTLGFGLKDVGHTMYVARWNEERGWDSGTLCPYGPLQLLPSAQVLNYGQGLFEGLKAQESVKGNVVVFRPDRNASRMKDGAERLCMPSVPEDQFVSAVKQVVEANKDFVPPTGKGALYIRGNLMGSGPILGLGPAPEYTFTVFAAAVGSYFKSGQMSPIHLLVDDQFHRSAPRGMGGTKAAGNYSPVLLTQLKAKKEGYSDVVYLDAKTDTYIEEVSSCNIFVRKGRTIKTPPLVGTILPGITRSSVIELASIRGYTVEETRVSIAEAMQADEVFTTGTAVVVSSVGSLTYKGDRKEYTDGEKPGATAVELYKALTDIQTERAPDPAGWMLHVCPASN